MSSASAADPAADPGARETPDNGPQVVVRPIAGATQTALVGETADPPGRSGLSHLVEHLWVTCAAGQVSVRTADAWAAAHPAGTNAQTGAELGKAMSTVTERTFRPVIDGILEQRAGVVVRPD